MPSIINEEEEPFAAEAGSDSDATITDIHARGGEMVEDNGGEVEEEEGEEEEVSIVINSSKPHVNTFETAIEEDENENDSDDLDSEDEEVEPIQASLVLQIVSSGPDGSANVKVRRYV